MCICAKVQNSYLGKFAVNYRTALTVVYKRSPEMLKHLLDGNVVVLFVGWPEQLLDANGSLPA